MGWHAGMCRDLHRTTGPPSVSHPRGIRLAPRRRSGGFLAPGTICRGIQAGGGKPSRRSTHHAPGGHSQGDADGLRRQTGTRSGRQIKIPASHRLDPIAGGRGAVNRRRFRPGQPAGAAPAFSIQAVSRSSTRDWANRWVSSIPCSINHRRTPGAFTTSWMATTAPFPATNIFTPPAPAGTPAPAGAARREWNCSRPWVGEFATLDLRFAKRPAFHVGCEPEFLLFAGRRPVSGVSVSAGMLSGFAVPLDFLPISGWSAEVSSGCGKVMGERSGSIARLCDSSPRLQRSRINPQSHSFSDPP